MIQFDYKIFFGWVGEKPPSIVTRNLATTCCFKCQTSCFMVPRPNSTPHQQNFQVQAWANSPGPREDHSKWSELITRIFLGILAKTETENGFMEAKYLACLEVFLFGSQRERKIHVPTRNPRYPHSRCVNDTKTSRQGQGTLNRNLWIR